MYNHMTITVLTDVMGTVVHIDFIRALTGYFRDNGVRYIETTNDSEVLELIDRIRKKTGLETGEEIVEHIVKQIEKRNLDPDYMALTGLVNSEGYQTGKLEAKVFDDVPRAFQRWKRNGAGIYLYSHGSEQEQREIFGHTTQGDLTHMIDGYFDTSIVGPKTKADSYKRVSDRLKNNTREMLFLSDRVDELDAADKAGCHVFLVDRPGNPLIENPKYAIITNFDILHPDWVHPG